MIKVMLCGVSGSGKTTLALGIDQIVTARGQRGCVTSFAHPLREFCRTLGFFKGSEEYRKVCQSVGEGLRQGLGPDVFVQALERRLRKIEDLDQRAVVVIDDGRYPNEVEWGLANGWKVYWLRPREGTSLVGQQADHPSEAYVKTCPEGAVPLPGDMIPAFLAKTVLLREGFYDEFAD